MIVLTHIGAYGTLRKARPRVPAHLHTGIDMQRPGKNYQNEAIYPIFEGRVISRRDDGPYAQLILEHMRNGLKFWSVYEHISGISVSAGDWVDPQNAMARFMNRQELNTYGWQFDHLHLEILKREPLPLQATKATPQRYFATYWLSCFSWDDLDQYYYNPLYVLEQGLN